MTDQNTTNDEPARGRTKEVKIRLPVQYHVRLHSMKVLTGRQISDAVTEALRVYFAGMEADGGVPDLANYSLPEPNSDRFRDL